jgi:hypothetical protein
VTWAEDPGPEIERMFSDLSVFDLWSGRLGGFISREQHTPGAEGYEAHKAAERERLARNAIAEGRPPGRVGRPPKVPSSPEEAARLEKERARDRARRPPKGAPRART